MLYSYLLSDPQSGIPLEVIARFQANMLVEPSEELSLFKNKKWLKNRIFIPAFWFETKMSLPDQMVFQMKLLSNLQTIFRITGYSFFGLALGAMIVIAVYFKVGVLDVNKRGPVLVEKDASSTSPIVNNLSASNDSIEGDDDRDVAPILNH